MGNARNKTLNRKLLVAVVVVLCPVLVLLAWAPGEVARLKELEGKKRQVSLYLERAKVSHLGIKEVVSELRRLGLSVSQSYGTGSIAKSFLAPSGAPTRDSQHPEEWMAMLESGCLTNMNGGIRVVVKFDVQLRLDTYAIFTLDRAFI